MKEASDLGYYKIRHFIIYTVHEIFKSNDERRDKKCIQLETFYKHRPGR